MLHSERLMTQGQHEYLCRLLDDFGRRLEQTHDITSHDAGVMLAMLLAGKVNDPRVWSQSLPETTAIRCPHCDTNGCAACSGTGVLVILRRDARWYRLVPAEEIDPKE